MSICKDCIHYEICDEYVSPCESFPEVEGGCKCFKNAADVVEVRHGEWKKLYDKAPRYVCTACNHLFNNKEYKYCPNCGAKMDGERKEL